MEEVTDARRSETIEEHPPVGRPRSRKKGSDCVAAQELDLRDEMNWSEGVG